MKSKGLILALALSMSMCLCMENVTAADSPVAATGGVVTVNTTIAGVESGTPVVVLIVPEKQNEQEEDITQSLLPQGTTSTELITKLKSSELNVEYFDMIPAGAGGSLDLVCKMKPSLSTGDCHVYITYLGADGWVKLDEFEHVGQNDLESLLLKFNGSVSGYRAAIEGDIAGKKVLEKSMANTGYYETLLLPPQTHIDAFINILASRKPNDGFDIFTLVDAFNESCAWIQLRAEADTLAVLTGYNEKYWLLPLAEDDFVNLSDEEKTKVMSALKKGNYTDSEKLAADFEKELVLALFRQLETREDVEAFINEGSKYGSYFSAVRSILSQVSSDAYKTALVYNDVLDENEKCETFDAVKLLFQGAVEAQNGGSDGGTDGGLDSGTGSGSGGGGGGKPVSKNPSSSGAIIQTDGKSTTDSSGEIPFTDVSKNHWAHSYVSRLYKEKVINGVSATDFAPNAAVQRQDFIKILIGAMGVEASSASSKFSDFEEGAYYEPYIITAVANGWISGMGDGSFGIGRNITREDAAVILSRVIGGNKVAAKAQFNDAAEISDYAKEAVAHSAASGIFAGDENGNFNPKQSLSRSEACAILCRLADKIKGV